MSKYVIGLLMVFFSFGLVGWLLISKQEKPEEILLFNGENLENWRGDLRVWSVENGCIVGRNSVDYKVEQNTFLIYENEFSDFELSFRYKIIGGNSGVQYRAMILDDTLFVVGGYQADIEAGTNYSGILYEEQGRGIMAKRGEKVTISESGEREVTQFKTQEEIQSRIKQKDWNDYKIVAKGNHLKHYINNIKTVEVTDDEIGKQAKSGIIALQVHAGPDMTVYYKDIKIETY